MEVTNHDITIPMLLYTTIADSPCLPIVIATKSFSFGVLLLSTILN